MPMRSLFVSNPKLILLLLILVSACAPKAPVETEIPVTSTIAVSTTSSFSSRPPLTGEWIGAVDQSDGKIASVQVNVDDSGTRLTIEPKTRSWMLNLVQNNEAVQFSATGEDSDPFKQIEFAGTFKEGVLSGEFKWDGTTSAVKFTPIVPVEKSVLEKYEGLYRFESGRALSIVVSPEYSSGGL